MGFQGSELFSLLLGRTERHGLITFILRDNPAQDIQCMLVLESDAGQFK